MNSGSRVPLRIAAFWGLGSMATTTMLNGVSVVLLYFLVTFIKVEPVVAGALLFGSKALDVLTDPPMGLLSDRTESRWGRRRPYLFGSAAFCGLAFGLLFNVPAGVQGAALYTFLVGALALYALSYTAFQVPYMAMPAELTDDYHERTRVMTWRVVFMTVGNSLGSAGVPALVGALGEDRAAYGQMGWLVGAGIALAMVLTAIGTSGARQTRRPDNPSRLGQHLRWLRANRPLLVLMAMKVFIYAGISSFVAVMLFFFVNVLERDLVALAWFGLMQAGVTIVCTPVWARLAPVLGKRRVYVISLLGFVLTMLSWLAATPDGGLTALLWRAALLGLFSSGSFLLGHSMLMDSFAWDYRQTGLRREGLLSAAFSFVEKASLALGPLVIGALLSGMGFDKSLSPGEPQPSSAITAMHLGFIWIPAGCQLVAIALLAGYRLDEAQLR